MSSSDIYKLTIEYGVEALKKFGSVTEIRNDNGLIDVLFNDVRYMSYCPSGPSNDSFWIQSPFELDQAKYDSMYNEDADGNKKMNISVLN
jgi:hypothetical protein